jgi:hypothetical protein
MSRAYAQTSQAQQRKEQRRKLLASINITWKELRNDLHNSPKELREARLDFASAELRIPPIGSFSELTSYQLGKVLEAMQREKTQPRLAGCNVQRIQPTSQASTSSPKGAAVVDHLASNEQTWAIGKILSYLRWGEKGREGFFQRNFRRNNQRMLTPKQAGSAIRILLGIAAARDIKARYAAKGIAIKVSEEMKRAELPALKYRIGIDAK